MASQSKVQGFEGSRVRAGTPEPLSLDFIFRPRSTAVIGASNREGSVGRALFANVLMNGYTGVVYPVNMTAKSVLGVKAYPTVLQIPDEVDLAVLIVPALAVPATLAECGQKKVKGAVVISAGFKELGPTGAQLELAVRDRARRYGIRLIGPNCFGTIDASPQVRLNATFGRAMPAFGNIALISQSGAVGLSALEYAISEEVGLSKFASIGNKADVNENDLLAYLRDDPETDVIMLYLEDLVNPTEFMRIARETTSNRDKPKPILAIKAGRTSEGARAASSHTGALAGSDAAYDAFFAQARILRVDTINELFAKGAALAYQPPPCGRRVAILTNAGGIGILATDACVRSGLTLAPLSDRTRTELRKHLPATAATNNPVDIIGDADATRYRTALELLVADENVDGLLPIWTPTLMAESSEVASITADIGQKSDKPILACIQAMMNAETVRRQLLRDHIPHYQFPENAARAMAAMADFSEWSRRPQGDVKRFCDVRPDVVKGIIERARSRRSRAARPAPPFVSEPEGHEILSAYGLPVPKFRLCHTADQAVAAAKEIGYPVVLKVVSPDVLHKTEFGGVRVNITDDARTRIEFAGLLETVESRKPDVDIWGVLVQQMATKGTETIIGMKRDPSFGPLLMFGLGGILVEVLKDVTFRIAPLNDISTDSMVNGIKAVKILQGFRGEPPRDVGKIKECLQRLSQLVTDFAEIEELDMNPLLVYEQGKGALVLDARFLLK
ncbi:CoA-binding protein [candidate division WOR-3 bacterium]|nr:CoA-binding protein [candidate division WOR-3 bacterium]